MEQMWKTLKQFPKFWTHYNACKPLSIGSAATAEDDSSRKHGCEKFKKKPSCCFRKFKHKNSQVLIKKEVPKYDFNLVKHWAKNGDFRQNFNYGANSYSNNNSFIKLPFSFEAIGLGLIVFLSLKHKHISLNVRNDELRNSNCPGLGNFLFSVVWSVRGSLPKTTPVYIPHEKVPAAEKDEKSHTEPKINVEKQVPPSPNKCIKDSMIDLAQQHASIVVNMNAEQCLKNNDLKHAIKYLERAGNLGYDVALYNLGVCYENGFGVQRNSEKAFHFYMEAGKRGNSAALYNVAVCYLNGIGTGADDDECLKYMQQASEGGIKEAQTYMGMYHGHHEEYDKAALMFQKAVEQKHSDAEYFLGLCYENGLGVECDVTRAVDLFEKSAASGNTEACYRLATFYEHGLGGVVENLSKASKLLQEAAEGGHELAIEKLKSNSSPKNDAGRIIRTSISSPNLNSATNKPISSPKSPYSISIFDFSFLNAFFGDLKNRSSKFYLEDADEDISTSQSSNLNVAPVNYNNVSVTENEVWAEPNYTLVYT